MATKRKVRTATTFDEAIALVLAAGINHDSIAAPWLAALRVHESEAIERSQSWPSWDDALARTNHCTLAQADHAAMKLARQTGEAIPPTPFLDEMKVRQATMVSTKAERSSGRGGGSRTPKASGIRFTHDGKLVSATQNKLSSVAWFYTKPLGKGGGRMKVAELKKLLAELGVSDPMTPGWSVKLPNEVTLGAVKEGETPTPIEKPTQPKLSTAKATKATKAAKATAKKSPAKKSPAKKRAAKKSGGAATSPLKKPMAPRKAPAAKVSKAG